MILNSTSDIIRMRLDGTVATNQLPFVTSYNDHTTTTFVPGDQDGVSNNATDVTIVSAPGASTQRQVTTINVYNADTVARGVIIEKYDGTNGRILCNCLLAVGDTLYWSREGGWTVMKTGTGGQDSIILQEYIASGTWNKPAGIKAALLVAVGAGAGGGSGARNAAGTNRLGAGGGGGGAMVWYFVQGASLSSSMSVTIGAGGTGGAAQTSDTTNGNAGTAGGDTSIGSFIIAKGGNPSNGASTISANGGAGGNPGSCIPAYGPYSLAGLAGSTGVTTGNTLASATMNGTIGAGAGGNGGRGINASNVSGTGTLTISGIYVNGAIQGATTTVGANGQDDLALSLVFSNTINGIYGLGTGGNGGDVAGAGGNGGRCAGGGGGGGSLNGTNSGKGGNGGGGLAKILEIY